jgi:hypothetical protein
VDQFAEKLNVKAQASQKMADATHRMSQTAARAKASAPPQVQHALAQAGARMAPVAQQVSHRAAPHRGKIIAALLSAAVILIVLRRRRAGDQS